MDIYDSFDNTDTGKQTNVEVEKQEEDSTYLIDSDGDGKWDYAYNQDTGLSTYFEYVYQKYSNIFQKTQKTPGFELISLLVMIALVLIILRRRK